MQGELLQLLCGLCDLPTPAALVFLGETAIVAKSEANVGQLQAKCARTFECRMRAPGQRNTHADMTEV